MAGSEPAKKVRLNRANEADERLLVKAAQRDASRFAALYENNFEVVYAYVARRVRDRAATEDLTSEVFHKALQNERETFMSTKAHSTQRNKPAQSAIREGFRTVTPYLVVPDVHEEIAFITSTFGAQGKVYGLGSAGGFHSEYRIGDSMLMIGGGGKGSKWKGTPVPVSLHVYVADVDGVYQRALQAGATSLMPPTDMDYGERGAAIEDLGGNHWYLATAMGPSYIPEGLPNLM